jgi:Anti-sigma-D factor RsdA to sigma factor binding region
VRNPGRRDGDDARAGSINPTLPQAGSDGGPADDDPAGMRAPDASRTTEPHSADDASPTGNDDPGNDRDGDLIGDFDLDLGLDAGPVDMDDDLLFDPLLSDEPIDLAAVRADDALIDALSGGDLAGTDDLADDDPLIAMLAAWAASARPEPAATGASPHLRPVTAAPSDETVGVETADGGHPDVPTTGSPGGEASEDGAPDTGSAEEDGTDGLTEPRADLDPPTVRLTGPRRPTAEDRPATPGSAASVVTLLSRVRIAGRRTRPPGQALPAGHPLRRAAVAMVVAALGVSAAAASGGTAQPGDPAWAITKVFFAERAESIEAAQVVSAALDRAQFLLSHRQPELAKQELAAISVSLPSVHEEDGHSRLLDQQRMLEAVAALTPPQASDPNLTSTTTPGRRADPDTSVLAQGAPRATGKDKAAPPVVAKPAGPTPGSTGATTGSTGTTDAGATGTGSTNSGSTNSGSTNSGSTNSGSTNSGSTNSGSTNSSTGTGSTSVGPTGTGPAGNGDALAESGTGRAANDTAPAGTDTGPANDTTLAEAGTGAQPVVPAPGPSLDGARSAGTDGTTTDGTTIAESRPSTTNPETGSPALATPPTADEPAPVTVLAGPEQAPADSSAPVDNQADSNGNPSTGAADTPKALAAGSAPAVPADTAGPAETGGAVVPDPVRTKVETGVVPEPVNAATPTTTAESTSKTSDKPTGDAVADRASSADTPADTSTHTTSAGDTPEPVHVTTEENRNPDSSRSGSGSGSNSGSNSGSDGGSSSGDPNNDNSGSDNSGSDNSGTGNSGSDNGGPGGARTSAAVSIHP